MTRARDLIQQVLDDEETGVRPDGSLAWGPDVTTVPLLVEARDLLDAEDLAVRELLAAVAEHEAAYEARDPLRAARSYVAVLHAAERLRSLRSPEKT